MTSSSSVSVCSIAFREPHSVVLQFRAGRDEFDDQTIESAVSRLSTHFASAGYFYNRAVPTRGAQCVDELRDCIRNVDDVVSTLRRCSPDLAFDDDENNTNRPDSSAAHWLNLLAKLLVHRSLGDDGLSASSVFRSALVVDALQRAFERRLVECRRIVLADWTEVLLRVQTRLDDNFVATLNRVVQRESAGRCAVQLMPLWRSWSPELADSVSLRLAVSAELGMVELSPKPGGQLAVSALLLLEPAAAALGFEPLTVTMREKLLPESNADDVRGKRKAKKAKKAPKQDEAENEKSSTRCAVQ
jgi:hypothetical protein